METFSATHLDLLHSMFSTTLPFLEMWAHPTLQTLQHLQQCNQTLFGSWCVYKLFRIVKSIRQVVTRTVMYGPERTTTCLQLCKRA